MITNDKNRHPSVKTSKTVYEVSYYIVISTDLTALPSSHQTSLTHKYEHQMRQPWNFKYQKSSLEPEFTEIWSQKDPDSSNFVPMWPTLGIKP